MIIKYQSWLTAYKELNSESGTQTLLDASNDTNNKAKVKSGKLSASDVAKENHDKKRHYEFCIFTEGEDIPYCCVSVVPRNKHVGVNFLDEAGREYLAYAFQEIREDRTLFLREVWYYHFLSDTDENEDYRIHYVFDEQGNINYRKYDERNQKIQDFEGNKRFDVSGLYEAYLSLGSMKAFFVWKGTCLWILCRQIQHLIRIPLLYKHGFQILYSVLLNVSLRYIHINQHRS